MHFCTLENGEILNRLPRGVVIAPELSVLKKHLVNMLNTINFWSALIRQ